MKNLLKSTNLIWAAIALLTASSLYLHSGPRHNNRAQRGGMERMRYGMDQQKSKWDGMRNQGGRQHQEARHKKEEK